ncbi:hypothetical protein F5Y13DRAFT_25247 [Hypoxylon sp. FL1857]|nr:hypothetical protein F5Y13DRAFT_25247 [Hypoxylon sp. FL1857]
MATCDGRSYVVALRFSHWQNSALLEIRVCSCDGRSSSQRHFLASRLLYGRLNCVLLPLLGRPTASAHPIGCARAVVLRMRFLQRVSTMVLLLEPLRPLSRHQLLLGPRLLDSSFQPLYHDHEVGCRRMQCESMTTCKGYDASCSRFQPVLVVLVGRVCPGILICLSRPSKDRSTTHRHAISRFLGSPWVSSGVSSCGPLVS